MIPMTPVESSQIASAGFDPVTGTLALQFKNAKGPGSVYQYPNWTQEKHDAFLAAESLGKHFGTHIRGNSDHPHSKVTAQDDQEAA